MKRLFLGSVIVLYSIGFIVFWILFAVTSHFWFKAETRFVNKSDATIEFTTIARNSTGSLFVLYKNGLFPLEPTHSYAAVQLQPGETAKLVWDWDDQIIHGFRISQEKKTSYLQIDTNKPEDCCYLPSQSEYVFTGKETLQQPPSEVDSIRMFSWGDRWKSYLLPFLFSFLFWAVLGFPVFFLGKKLFVRSSVQKSFLIANALR
ncbi:MAG: hypothetical protein AB7F59_10210 [Bdellovibrionales bacterium]